VLTTAQYAMQERAKPPTFALRNGLRAVNNKCLAVSACEAAVRVQRQPRKPVANARARRA
jgi:hypothetical protein